MTSTNNSSEVPSNMLPLWGTAFRPFFLFGSFVSLIWMILWLLSLSGKFALKGSFGMMAWHSHEMIFGFATAIIAGFLMTAVQNWTGLPTAKGKKLMWISLLWLAGRVAVLSSSLLPLWLVAIVDLSMLPVLAGVIAVPLWQAKSWRNIGFVPVLLLLDVAHLFVYLELFGVVRGWASKAIVFGLHLVVVIIVVVAGRIIPIFTRNKLRKEGVNVDLPMMKPLGRVAIGLLFGASFVQFMSWDARVWGIVYVFASVLLLFRFFRWKWYQTIKIPMLWILHVGFFLLCSGLVWEGSLGFWRSGSHSTAALHLIGVGGIGMLIIGMIARVSLGHSGRVIVAHPLMITAFFLMIGATALRVIPAVWFPTWYSSGLLGAGLLWCFSFLLFLIVYTPILLRPRADGRPG